MWPDMRKGPLRAKYFFCHFSNCHHSKTPRALGFWLGLLAVWAFYFKDPTLEATVSLLYRATKDRHKTAIDQHACPAHTGNGSGSKFAANVGWWKNIHARFEVHSCYGSRDIIGKSAKWSLSLYPVTYVMTLYMVRVIHSTSTYCIGRVHLFCLLFSFHKETNRILSEKKLLLYA